MDSIRVIEEIRKVQSYTLQDFVRYGNETNQRGAYIKCNLFCGKGKNFLIVDLKETREGKLVSGPEHPGILFQFIFEDSLIKKQYTYLEFYTRTAESIWRDFYEN